MLIFSAFFLKLELFNVKKKSIYNVLIEHFSFKGDSAMQVMKTYNRKVSLIRFVLRISKELI